MQTRISIRSLAVCAALVLGLTDGPASAQQGASMPGMTMSSSPDAGSSAATPAFKAATRR